MRNCYLSNILLCECASHHFRRAGFDRQTVHTEDLRLTGKWDSGQTAELLGCPDTQPAGWLVLGSVLREDPRTPLWAVRRADTRLYGEHGRWRGFSPTPINVMLEKSHFQYKTGIYGLPVITWDIPGPKSGQPSILNPKFFNPIQGLIFFYI